MTLLSLELSEERVVSLLLFVMSTFKVRLSHRDIFTVSLLLPFLFSFVLFEGINEFTLKGRQHYWLLYLLVKGVLLVQGI